MDNNQIADIFDQIADLLEFRSANPFRIRAYRNGSRILRDMDEQVAGIVRDENRNLTDLDGIGKDLADKITTLVTTGELPMLQDLLSEIPVTVLDLLKVPQLGPKKAGTLFWELNITSLEELEKACKEGKIQQLKGFGKKTEEAILKGVAIAEDIGQRITWADAELVVEWIGPYLDEEPAIENLQVAGSFRRGKETIGDIDFLASATEPAKAMQRLADLDGATVLVQGETKTSVRLLSGLQVDLRVVPQEAHGAALLYFTGSQAHNIELRRRAKDRGMKVNEYGLFRIDPETEEEALVASGTEEAIYNVLDLEWIPPELREARQEFQWAENDEMPELITIDDIRGDLHMHSTASDGSASIEEMAEAAHELGYEYIAITDHSPRVMIANGLAPERLLKQWKEIDRLNKKLHDKWGKFQILKGVECDVLEQGGLDLSDDILAQADWVLASIHYGQRQSRQQITQRMLEAVENPYIHVIAHPTGRMLTQRPAYEVDLDAVMQAAANNGTMMEINSSPWRLDLNDVHTAAAKKLGIKIVVNTDAHRPESLADMRHGVQQARRGGLTAGDVVNTLTWSKLKKILK